MLDTVAHIDPGSLQHQGEYALSLTRVFAAGDLASPRGGETVYFNLVGGLLVVYPRSWALPLAVVLAAALYVARRLALGAAAPAAEPLGAPGRRRQQPPLARSSWAR